VHADIGIDEQRVAGRQVTEIDTDDIGTALGDVRFDPRG
jgi:hypothetical protein